MLDLINESGDPHFFANAVIQSLTEPPKAWDTEQRFCLARLLAQRGDQSARQAMYVAFRSLGKAASDVALAFIELDGIKGLLFVAAEIGAQLAQNPEQWEDESLLLDAERICGKEATESALATAAKADARIQSYLAAVEENRALRAANVRPDAEALSYSEVKARIEGRGAAGILRRWSKTATYADLTLAAHDLFQETNPKRVISYLQLFGQRTFPLEVDLLLQLVEQPDGPVPRHALRALAKIEHEKVRSLALSLVESGAPNRIYAVDLLTKNFREGDHARVAAWWDAETDPDVLQPFGSSLVNFLITHPDPSTDRNLLLKIYEQQPCDHCRFSVVKRLIELKGLTPELSRECEYDSYSETRNFVRPGHLSAPQR